MSSSVNERMSIEMPKEDRLRMIHSIQRYFEMNLDEHIGELKAGFMLDFILKEIAPSVYNQAISDAQAYLGERVLDLGATCFEEEFQFWD